MNIEQLNENNMMTNDDALNKHSECFSSSIKHLAMLFYNTFNTQTSI